MHSTVVNTLKIGLFGFVGVFGLVTQAKAQAWMNPAWAYRVPVTITNSAGTSLTNFQVNVQLNSSFNFGGAQSNGADLRATAGDGTTLLAFWIQNWTPASSASIWVQVPSIPTSGATIYLYYGNPSAASASNGTATFLFFDDFSYSVPATSFINNALTWLLNAAVGTGGNSSWYDTTLQAWTSAYPEVTGYTIPTFYDAAAATTDPVMASNLRTRAQQMADYEVSIQGGDGSFAYVFDTGQVIEGLVRAYQETRNSTYLNAAVKAGNWLISQQAANGSWPTDFGGFAKPYAARVSRALLKLWQATGTVSFMNAAINNLNWDVSQQQSNGWFNNLGIQSTSQNGTPLTHTIAYTMEGLLDSGIILNNTTYINSAKKAADALLGQQLPDGALNGGEYFSNWTPAVGDQCLTGSAQTALVWLKLYQYTVSQGNPNIGYLNAAHKLNQYLVSVQGNSSNPGIMGGLAGSDPLNGVYMPNDILSWATKFLVDDLSLESKLNPGGVPQFYYFDPSKWSVPAQREFGSTGGTFQYYGITAGTGPRAIAMSGGTNLTFTSGIVEYNLQGNGGYDELGLVYRGQNPETNNSYVFYQSIWNSQNTWLLYGLFNTNQTFLGSGGTFNPGVTYAIQAAINGSSHTFSVNGSPIFQVTNSQFASGTIGLFGWGNAIASVTGGFRIRKYAAVDPSTSVGAQQLGAPGVTSVSVNPANIAGGNPVTGTVTLNTSAGATVTLTSSNPSVAQVPASVSLAAGATSANFPISTFTVSAATSVTITASFNGSAQQASLLVTPGISSVTVNPVTVVGGNGSTGTVALTGPAPSGGAVVSLSSSNTNLATVPGTATVPAGATSATFAVNTAGVASSQSATITASYGGSSGGTTITATPATLTSLTLNPSSVVGGSLSTGTVTLNGAAPPGGAVVSLSSSNTAAATVPSSVTVNAGATQGTFQVTTSFTSVSTSSVITATYNGNGSSPTLTILQSGWLGTGWAYRVPVTVSNATGSTLTNFQVHVVLSSSFNFANAQTNGGDIRFTASDGTTLLAYWLESWNSGTSASIWVQVASIPTTGTTIYMYYGNPSVTSASNGSATFPFFDDFSYTSGGSPAIDPSKWSFPAGQAGFANLGGTLQYNASAGIGPRMIAMSGGSNITFTNGIAEYNLQGNGGYDEFGLVYRGQNPETSNSYVFFPSIYNSQNTWLLYSRVSGGSVRLGGGGTFMQGVWYAVRAAIGGTSYTFSINGSQVFITTDSQFSSGTVGLFAWGNANDLVTNFRIRQYASAEPSTATGAQQVQH